MSARIHELGSFFLWERHFLLYSYLCSYGQKAEATRSLHMKHAGIIGLRKWGWRSTWGTKGESKEVVMSIQKTGVCCSKSCGRRLSRCCACPCIAIRIYVYGVWRFSGLYGRLWCWCQIRRVEKLVYVWWSNLVPSALYFFPYTSVGCHIMVMEAQ